MASGKKILAGCLIAGLLILFVGGGVTWWFVLRPAWNAGSQFFDSAAQMASLSKLDSEVKNRTAFTPPASGRISDEGLARFILIQRDIRDRLGPTIAPLEQKYREMEANQKSGREPSLTQLVQAYGDVFSLLHESKKVQVEALNAHGMSLAEYRWTRQQAYQTLAAELAAQQRSQASSDDDTPAPGEQRLIPHRDLLQETAVMNWIGL